MASFSDDFSSYPTGAGIPAGWSSAKLSTLETDFSVVESPADIGDPSPKALAESAPTNQERLVSMDAAGVANDCHVIARVRSSIFNAVNRIAVRVDAGEPDSSSGEADYGLYLNISASPNVRLVRINGVSQTLLGSIPYSLTVNTWYWMELQAEGAWLRARIWSGANLDPAVDRPASWDLQVEDTDPDAHSSGGVGLGFNKVGAGDAAPSLWFDVIYAGMDGSDPLAEPDPVPDTPTLTVDTITDTTAELASSAFSGPAPHVSSRWQVAAAGTDFAAPVADSGTDAVNLLSFSAGALEPETSYEARVLHTNENGDSEWSAAVGFSTIAAHVGPGQPTLTVSEVEETTARLSSSAFTGDGPHTASRWQVAAAGTGFADPVVDSGVDAVNLLALEVTDLPDGTDLEARVRHYDELGVGEWSAAVAFSTILLIFEPGPAPPDTPFEECDEPVGGTAFTECPKPGDTPFEECP